MSGVTVYGPSGGIIELWDDSTSTFTEWSDAGVEITSRPYTTAESQQAAVREARAAAVVARANLSDLLAQQSAFGTQLQADISTVTSTGWAALSAADQQAIMLRVLDGFGTVMTAIVNHLTVTGIT